MITYYTGIFIGLCWFIFIVVWVFAAFATKRTIERQSWWWSLVLLAFVAAIILIRRTDWFAYLSGALVWQHMPVTEILGAAVTLLGLCGALWARATLGSNWSSAVVIKKNHELIERGPYHWVRHPIYSSLLVMFIGGAIWDGHAILFADLILVVFGLWFKARQEERILTKYFPTEYPEYMTRVKGLIPFVV